MHVLLISPNIEMLPDPVAPLGLAFLSSSLKAAGHEVGFLDLCFAENIEAGLKTSISNFSPEVIGLSLRNVDNVSWPDSVSYLPFYRRVIDLCRQLTHYPIFLGGAGFTLMPRAILNYLQADGGIAGEGEEAFPQILTSIAEDGIGAFRGVQEFLRDRSIFSPACIENLESLPSPDWEGVNLKEYFRRGGMGNLQTKRGCPFSCLYCTYPMIEGKRLRLRSPSRVAAEAESLVEKGVGNVFLADNMFTFPESHARNICRSFRQKGISLKWSCYAHPAFLSPSLAEEMKKTGCTGVEFGTDSGAPAVLSKLKKDFTPGQIRNATRVARDAGLEVCHSLSLGAPGETGDTLEETFSLMEEVTPTAVIAMVGLRVFPGTGLARLAVDEKMMSPDHDMLEPFFYVAPAVKDHILEIVHRHAETHPNWIFPGLGINVSPSLQSKLRKFGIKGPLWEHMKIMRERQARKGEKLV